MPGYRLCCRVANSPVVTGKLGGKLTCVDGSLESSKRKVGFPYLGLCCMDRKEWFERSKRQLKFSEATENLTEVDIRIQGTRTNVGSSRNDRILKGGSDMSPLCFEFCVIKSLFIY